VYNINIIYHTFLCHKFYALLTNVEGSLQNFNLQAELQDLFTINTLTQLYLVFKRGMARDLGLFTLAHNINHHENVTLISTIKNQHEGQTIDSQQRQQMN